jgi:hypothetical protein
MMLLYALIPICSVLTFMPSYLFLRGRDESICRSIFLFNSLAFFISASIISLMISGISNVILVAMGVMAAMAMSRAKYEGRHGINKKVLSALLATGIAFIVLVALWGYGAFAPLNIAQYASIIYPAAFCLVCFGILNLMPLPGLFNVQESKAKRVLRILTTFLLVCIAATIFTTVISRPTAAAVDPTGLDTFSVLFFNILNNPQMSVVLSVMVLGALVKTLPWDQAKWIGDALYIWVPFLVWILVFIGVTPVPNQVLELFQGYALLGWITYILLFACIFVIVAAMISLFTSFSEKFRI